MIAKLRGLVDSYGEDYAVIDVSGVGYLVYASAKTLSKMVKGTETSLQIETIVREDSISLFGFMDAWEKEWFNTLTKVQGVGSKVCLAILSVLSPVQLAQAISAQDKTSFTRANGVGPKLAARIVTELKDKIVTPPVGDISSDIGISMEGSDNFNKVADIIIAQETDPNKLEDAISALVNLGYQRLDAYKVVNQVVLHNPDADMATLIRLSLKEFANKD